jgi:uncharacterized protein YceK
MRNGRVIGVAVGALLLSGCGSSESESTPSKYASSSPEYQLALIDDHGGKPSDSQVERYVSVLDQLQRICTDSRRQLADWASSIKADINPRDSEAHLLGLAVEQAKRAEAQGAVRSGCHEVFLLVGVAAKGGA